MSLTPKFHVPMLLSLILLVLVPISTAKASDSTPLHEVLRNHGLPEGLFPQGVRSYKLDQNGALEVHLGRPCLAHYETRVFFDSVVKANLSFGKLKVLEGMSRQELFLWLPVKDIIVTDPSSGLVVIDIGFAFKHLSFSRFDNSPTCITHPPSTSLGLALKIGGRKGFGFSDQ